MTVRKGTIAGSIITIKFCRIDQDGRPLPRPARQAYRTKNGLIVRFIGVSGIRQSMQASIDRIIAQAPAENRLS